jgi:hypothetical protein
MLSRRFLALTTSVVVVGGLSQLSPAVGAPPGTAHPKPLTKNVGSTLGNGLGRLVSPQPSRPGNPLKVDQSALTIRDGRGRVLIDLTPQAGADRARFRAQAEALGLVVRSVDKDLGTLEGFAPLSAMTKLAALPKTGTIAQALRPVTHVGATTSQGVTFERADLVHAAHVKGQGMTIGVLSDSYDTAQTDVFGGPLDDHAADDVKSGDLPGPGNPQNRKPVVVIQDSSGPETDEGRAMLQIVHDMAPKAKLCFATAFEGDVSFANNIRALADPSGPCGADVIVDDVSYFDEPFFSDGPIGDAVDDVAAEGVSYFSSSGNAGDHNAWDSPLHLVSGSKVMDASGLDFSQVDPALYAGGFQDMNPGRGVDIAQDYTMEGDGGLLDLQWNDPVDKNGATLGAPYFTQDGELTAANTKTGQTFQFTPTADQLGKEVLVTADGIPSGSVDLILQVTKPDGTVIGPVDTGSSPEKTATKLDQPGTYTITVSGFGGATGPFNVQVQPVLAPSKVTTDFNVLAFAPDGSYLGAIGDDNTLTGRPSEVFSLSGIPQIQFVIARATTGSTPVTHIRAILNGDLYVSEYFNPSAPATFGHPTAAGAIGVGAYDPFKSFLPEPYTSPGGKLKIYFDSDGNRYATPRIRTKPEVSATDRGNTTFFVADDTRDGDSFPNFGGTSASAPHAAAIAALMIQKAGGPGSMKPGQVRRRLEHSTFAHDLDPFRAAGRAAGLSISAVGSQSDERNSTPGSLADPNFFRVRYTGKVPLKSITFYGETASPTSRAGLVFDPRPMADPGSFRTGGFPFTVGSTKGIRAAAISASFARHPAYAPFGVFSHMTVKFRKVLRHGQAFRFGVDRDAAIWSPGTPAIEGNGADELGGAVAMPSGRMMTAGMRFTAVRKDGTVINGRMTNALGKGWTPVDGYGVVNAEKAVLGK